MTPHGMFNKDPCTLHGIAECLACAPPDEYYRWRVQNDPTLAYGWNFYNNHNGRPVRPPE